MTNKLDETRLTSGQGCLKDGPCALLVKEVGKMGRFNPGAALFHVVVTFQI